MFARFMSLITVKINLDNKLKATYVISMNFAQVRPQINDVECGKE